MTISITVSQCSFEGDGSSVTFPIADGSNGIYFTSSDEIAVTVDGATVSPSAYAVSGAGTDSGSITFTSAPADGTAGIIKRNTVITQGLSLTRGGYLSPTSVMESIDKLTRIDQDQQRQIDDIDTRINDTETAATSAAAAAVSATNAATSAAAAATSATAAASAATASATSATASAASATSAASNLAALQAIVENPGFDLAPGSYLLDDISGSFNGSTTTFDLTLLAVAKTPASASQLIVHVGNSYQTPGTGYTVAGSQITFTSAPASGLTCAIVLTQIDTSDLEDAEAAAAASASAASSSATSAASSATTATTQASAAATSATSAATNAAAAATSATAAQTAETNAESAQALAEAARDAAIAASETLAWGYTFDSGTADADPGSAKLRFNHATFGSATYIYISETADEGDISALMAVWDDSSSAIKATVQIRDPLTPTTWLEFYITGAITDAGTYRKIPISPIAAGGVLSNGATIRLAVTRNGDAGSGAVDSFNGRTGAVTPAASDYGASQIANDSGVSGATVAAALDALNSGKQGLDATLTALAALGSAADKGIYFTAVDTAAEFTLTSAGRALVDDADAAAQRTTLDVQTYLCDDISASFNGSTTTFDLTQSAIAVTPRAAKNVVCSIGGCPQIPGTGFTVSGSQITFSSAPAGGLTSSIQIFNA